MNQPSPRIAIIGAGPSGLATGHELLAKGFRDFTIFEKSAAVGGTWHNQTYPGLACDVWAHSYTFSYAPNPDWSASFAEQPEIEAYLQRCATEFGLDPHVELNTRIVRMQHQEDGTWTLTTEAGERHVFDVVVNAMGNQHTALFPDVKGVDAFEGPSWHATEWNHDVDLSGRRVAVIGSAAAAVQVVPEVAKQAAELFVLQRTANWIMPRGRVPYSESRRRWFRRVPALLRATQRFQRFLMSFVHEAATLGHARQGQFEKRVIKFIEQTVPDPELREILTPKSRYACKRGLVSDDFYPTLMEDHVELVPEGLREVRPTSIVTASGRELDVDVIVYCTGYRILDFDRIEVIGSHGESLAKVMSEAPEAFKGIAAPGFPNYFFAVGPNGLVLNVPYFTTVERNVETIVRLLDEARRSSVRSLEVKASVHREYNDWMLTQFPTYSWGNTSCNSYYQLPNGRAPFLFPGDFKAYERFHEAITLDDFETA